MSTKATGTMITIGGTLVALLAGPRGPLGGFWRPAAAAHEPAAWQLGGLMTAGVAEAVGFGLAVALLALGRPAFARLAGDRSRTTAAHLAAAWLLGSWWAHSALHQHVGPEPGALVAIELVFHVGSILAAGVLLWVTLTRERAGASPVLEQLGQQRP